MRLPHVTCIFLLIIFARFVLTSCNPDKETPNIDDVGLLIHFLPRVDAAPMKLGDVCVNSFNEQYRISKFKFYVCKFELIDADGNKVYRLNVDDYFLIDAADSGSFVVSLKAPSSVRYNRIAFTIGVDSIRNISGAQTGALDPAKAMFWTWNSGYIMAKLEGTSSVSSFPNQAFEYHIGGFKGSDNVLQRVELSFPTPQYSLIKPSGKSSIEITANANVWFTGFATIKIAETPACTSPGPLAKSISENYKKMFTVVSVE